MRQGSNTGRRPRGRTNRKQHGGGGGGGGQSRTNTFDSNGPDGRVRGNARQVYEKYLTLARDATSAGDRIAAEVYHQYAEHYFRILSDSADPQPAGRRHDDRQPQGHSDDDERDGDEPGAANGASVAPERAPAVVNKAPVEVAAAVTPAPSGEAPSGGVKANGQEGEAPAKPRRGRPRKPRVSDEGQPAKVASEPAKVASEPTKTAKATKGPETEDGPAAG